MNQNQTCPHCGVVNKVAGLRRVYTFPGSGDGKEDQHWLTCVGCDKRFLATDDGGVEPKAVMGSELGTGEFKVVEEVMEGDAD